MSTVSHAIAHTCWVERRPDLTGRLSLDPGSNSFTNGTLHLRRWIARNSFVMDEETFYVVVTHKAQTWARNGRGYTEQSYALAVTSKTKA